VSDFGAGDVRGEAKLAAGRWPRRGRDGPFDCDEARERVHQPNAHTTNFVPLSEHPKKSEFPKCSENSEMFTDDKEYSK
jgi:hypothetical protein